MAESVTPDYEISIGVKDGKVCGIHFEDISKCFPDVSAEQIPYMIESYLSQALEMIKTK